VILEPHQLSKGVSLNLRVVGVRYGVALGWWDYTVGQGGASDWSKGAALQIKNLVPGIKSSEQSAVPVSFVGFTSPLSSPDSTLLEREINSLFLKRLGAEAGLIVLERQKLAESAFEKILNSDDRKFWSGAWLLDGTINPETISGDSITVRCRLTGSQQKNAEEFVLNGSHTNLAGLAAEFVNQVQQRLHSGNPSTAWDAPAEARRFYEEGELAVRWGFWPEARAAADTALALGKDDLDTRRLQLNAYTGLFTAEQSDSSWQAYKPGFWILTHYNAPTSPESLQVIVDLACQLDDLARQPSSIFQSVELRESVKNALTTIGQTTLKFYIGAELRHGNEEKLLELRETMREVTTRLLGAEEVKQIYYAGPLPNDPPSARRMESVTDVLAALLKSGPLWQETPEDGVLLQRKLRSSLNFSIVEKGLDDPKFPFYLTPSTCGWNPADRLRVDKIQEAFQRENKLLAEARIWLYQIWNSENDLRLERDCQRALSFFRSNYDQLITAGYQTSFATVFRKSWSQQEELVATNTLAQMLTNEVAPLDTLLTRIDQANARQSIRLVQDYFAIPNRSVDRVALCLAKKQVPSADLLKAMAFQARPEDTDRALDVVDKVSRLPDSPEKQRLLPLLEQTRRMLMLRQQMTEFPRRRFQPRASPAGKTSMDVNSAEAFYPLTAQAIGLGITTNSITPPAGAARVTMGRVFFAADRPWIYCEAVFARADLDSGIYPEINKYYLISIEPASGRPETIEIPERFYSALIPEAPAEFMIFADRVVLFFSETELVYDRHSKTFSEHPAPLYSAHVLQSHGRSFLYNEEGILETFPGTNEFRVLASVRRRPAVTVLDALPSLKNAQLLCADENHVYALITNQLYLLDTNQWRPVRDPDSAKSVEAFSGEFFLHESVRIDEKSNHHRASYFGPTAPEGELWWNTLEKLDEPVFSREQRRLVNDASGVPGKYTSIPATGELLLFRGNLLIFSFPHTNGNPTLDFWLPGSAKPIRFSVVSSGFPFEGNLYAGTGPRLPVNYFFAGGNDIYLWNVAVAAGCWRIDGNALLAQVKKIQAAETTKLEGPISNRSQP
jgi:hypothetical protein